MKRSDIEALKRSAEACFAAHGWTLPPNPKWDVTDFGLGDWRQFGLVLINLAEEPEYCEKLMYAQRGMTTPAHTHRRKKEDIIARWGTLQIQVWLGRPDAGADAAKARPLTLSINGEHHSFTSGDRITLPAGHRVTLTPGVYHEFQPLTEECIIGEVSTANDDENDNVFFRDDIGRFPEVTEE